MKNFVDLKRKELVKQKQKPTRKKIIEFVHEFFDQLRKVTLFIYTSCTLKLRAILITLKKIYDNFNHIKY